MSGSVLLMSWPKRGFTAVATLAAWSCVLASIVQAQVSPPKAAAVDFQRQIRPILSDNCFHCHGPDKGTRMAGLRLDTHEGLIEQRKNGVPVVPGKSEESLIVKRVYADKPSMIMPPAYSHKTLTTEQKETIRRWIEQGAEWKEQWALVAPVRSSLPEVKAVDWARNPIDRFILAKLEANGLQPAPQADRRTLIRRLSLDLTGLPPEPAEVEAFASDASPEAYERLVNRLLASPHYGEHRARYWLDAARYADTHGIHIDNFREMWPYRDWVINAFNRNLPFDRFTIEQLAGDLLPNASLEQKIASGFHRCNVTTNEGGVIPEEYAAVYAKDRVDTTGTVWLGLTVGCATCHDHKFDPISQKDYYSLAAFFRNTTQNPLDGNIPDTPPMIVVPRPEDRDRWEQLDAKRMSLKKHFEVAAAERNAAFEAWLRSPARLAVQAPYSYSSKVFEIAVNRNPTVLRKGQRTPIALPPDVTIAEGPQGSGQALLFGEKGYVKLPNLPEIDAGKPFTISTWVYLPKKQSYVIASQFEPEPKEKPKDARDRRRGWSIEISGQGPSIKLAGAKGKYISTRPGPDYKLQPANWYHLVFTNDGSRDRSGLSLFVNGKFVPSRGTGEDLEPLESSAATGSPLRLGNDKKRFFEKGAIAEFRVLDRRVDEQQAELLSVWSTIAATRTRTNSKLTDPEREALKIYYLYRRDPATREIMARWRAIDAERYSIRRRSAVTLVMQERADSKPLAHILYRGQYDQQREEVQPNVPAVLPAMLTSAPRNRLGLATWLMDPANPLTARVTVNRFWQEIYGTGIVKTTEDFGSQGEAPSHPELLDWMAVEFRESGWDVKKLLKLIVASATYRQSFSTTAEKLRKDPENRLLSRGPRFRMDAEMVRDYALAASGLLVPAIGGPSVKPYQPAGIWETVAMEESNTRFYKPDHGDKLYRRSMYTFWKRSAPPGSMDIFNAPTHEVCTVRRERTNTPLQALVTMNDPQFVEAARTLAQRAILKAKTDLDRQINFMASRLLARSFDDKEREIVKRSYRDYLSHYDAHPTDAAKLLNSGESKADQRIPKPELAALTMVANELMNLDEVLNK
jgi:hypothetical protein